MNAYDMTPQELRDLADKKELRKLNVIPSRVTDIDFSKVMDLTDEHLNELLQDAGDEEDSKQYLYEELMESIYGKKIFDWINSVTN